MRRDGIQRRWLVAALSACHQLWYLHLCADAGIIVLAYNDDASGVEIEQADGAGYFQSVTLRPHATLVLDLMSTRHTACAMPPPRNALSRARHHSR